MGAIVPVLSRSMRLLAVILIALLLICCDKKRPPGFLDIGKASVVAQKSGFLEDKQVYLVRDERGIAVMSTLCTHDLSKLRLINENGAQIFVSDFNPSRYDLHGRVLSGPADHDLPFYSVRLDSGIYGGAKDTLYVDFGREVSRDWRLRIDAGAASLPAAAPSPP